MTTGAWPVAGSVAVLVALSGVLLVALSLDAAVSSTGALVGLWAEATVDPLAATAVSAADCADDEQPASARAPRATAMTMAVCRERLDITLCADNGPSDN
jgi:hypothetical protein